jgi:hypothetical protein
VIRYARDGSDAIRNVFRAIDVLGFEVTDAKSLSGVTSGAMLLPVHSEEKS